MPIVVSDFFWFLKNCTALPAAASMPGWQRLYNQLVGFYAGLSRTASDVARAAVFAGCQFWCLPVAEIAAIICYSRHLPSPFPPAPRSWEHRIPLYLPAIHCWPQRDWLPLKRPSFSDICLALPPCLPSYGCYVLIVLTSSFILVSYPLLRVHTSNLTESVSASLWLTVFLFRDLEVFGFMSR